MKKTTFLILSVVLFSIIAGCEGREKETKRDGQLFLEKKTHAEDKTVEDTKLPKKNIALVMKTLTNPFFIEMEKGARRAEDELGIHLIVKTGAKETSIEQQIAIVGELIQQKIDAIVIAPGSSTELIPVLKRAQDAKIPIVNIDNRIDPEVSKKIGLVGFPFVSVDNVKGAYLSSKYICDKITTPMEVALLEGIRSAMNAEQRKRGALKAFKENPHTKIVAMETANWKVDEAYEVTSKLYSKYPNIGALFCANDMMALGAIQYLQKTSRKEVLVAGYDALEEAKKAIKEGKLQATIDQQAAMQGYIGVKYAMDLIQGKELPTVTLIDVKLVTLKDVS